MLDYLPLPRELKKIVTDYLMVSESEMLRRHEMLMYELELETSNIKPPVLRRQPHRLWIYREIFSLI